MRKLIEKFLWLAVLVSALQSTQAFSPGGPNGNNHDGWQTPSIGYNIYGDDWLSPKNIGEEYRRVTPVMYYAFDATFLGYYGSVGATNIDGAFSIMNNVLSNGVSSYSPDFSAFSLESQQINYTAQTLGLMDLRSWTLHLLTREMGLADPNRFVWTLHDRLFDPAIKTPKCPQDEQYLVVQRNLDINPYQSSPYSSYINGTLFTFSILEDCGQGGPPDAVTVTSSADPFASAYTAVASLDAFQIGGFYPELSRDDVAGLTYLLSSNNIRYEATAPSGGLLLSTNIQPATNLLTTLPISLLFSQSLTNDPVALANLYPGLTYLSVQTNIVNQVSTNLVAYFTNLTGPFTNYGPNFTNWSPVQYGNVFPLTTFPLGPLLSQAITNDPLALQLLYPGLIIGTVNTNFLQVLIDTNVVPYFTNQSVLPVFSNTIAGGLPNVTTLTNIYYFTNQPGPTVINYDTTVPFSTISTLDLATFSDTIKTNDPATILGLYPGLQILKTNTFPSFVSVTNYVSYLTNAYGSPYQGPPKLVTTPTETNYIWITNWTYRFGNIFTNHYYTNRYVRVQSIYTTNIIGAVWPSFQTVTNIKTIKTNLVSGDFFIIPTNWCGFDLALSFPLGNPPYKFGNTNIVVYGGYTTNGSVGTNYLGGSGTNLTIAAQTYGSVVISLNLFTNYNYAVYPGICEPVAVYGINYSTNIVNTYDYGFINLITNHFYTNTLVTVLTTNVSSCFGGSPDVLCTNISSATFYTNTLSGDFYIIPPTWCGFQKIGLLTNLVSSTNNFVATNSTGNNNNGQFYTITTISYFTNYTFAVRPGFCEPALNFSTNYSTNIITQYKYYFGSIITNNYYTNGSATVVTTNLAIFTNGLVGTLTNIVTTNVINSGVGGDFFILPTNWCAYSIVATQLTSVVYTTNQFTATNQALPDLGQRYTQTTISSQSNTTFLVQPSTCDTATPSPALRRGIERVQFVRANYDSLLGQFFQPLTNTYMMVMITNGQSVKEFYQRVVTRPDFLFQAADLTGPNFYSAATPYGLEYFHTIPGLDQSTVLQTSGGTLAGPGTITPASTFVFNKSGQVYLNGSRASYGLSTNAFIDPLGEINQSIMSGWGSFDGSTNYPVIYPDGASISNLIGQIFIQVTPSGVSDGTTGVPYAVAFTATGGLAPYVWAAPNISALVPGLTFNPATATLSGTPSAAGSFSFVLQLTDSANRVVNLNYSILIH
jgi:hypothetical protein